MKCTIPEISWHNREPVLSVDIFPEIGQSYRLASAGGDCHVLIWQMNIASNGAVTQELISDLTRHQKAVNCVRWSTTGKYLATGDDDANIIIWILKTDNIPLLEGDTGDKEIWNVFKIMRGHKEDVYDICWSIDETKILSGSVDNTAILWDVSKGKMDHILSDHKGFVQGVAWDPKNQFIATISTDRICRIFDTSGKHVKSRIQKGKLSSVPEGHFLKDKDAKYFHDDTFKSFFRRLQFTPDGSLLIVPSGHIEVENCTPVNATLIFTLDNLSCPSIILPIPKQSSTVVRVCPVLYELHENGPDPSIKLPYRMVFAVGTDHDIILYDTQQPIPFARFRDIHYTRLTDLTWSKDGLLLVASSTDGFCSLITFELDELGVPWVKMETVTEENPLEISGCEELDKDENVDTNNKDLKTVEDVKVEAKKRTSFLEQWALNTPKKRRIDETDKKAEVIDITESDMEDVDKPKEIINKLIPRRKAQITDKAPNKNSEEHINILVPKRIKPTFIEPLASTSKVKDSPDEEIIKSDNEEESSESEEELSKEEQKDYIKASQNIQQLFGKKPQTLEKTATTDITPTKEKINVLVPRRVKRTCTETKAEINSTKSELKADIKDVVAKKGPELQNTDLPKAGENNSGNIEEKPPANEENEHSNSKSVPIRRKSKSSVKDKMNLKESATNRHSDAKPITVKRNTRAKKDGEETSIENKSNSRSKNEENKHSDAKPITVKRKSRASESKKEEEKSALSENEVNLIGPKNEDSVDIKESEATPAAVESKPTESIIIIDEENTEDENSIGKPPKKGASPKKPVFKLKLTSPKEKASKKDDPVIDLVSNDDKMTTPKKLKLALAKKDSPSGKPKASPKASPKAKSSVIPKKQMTTILSYLKQKTENPPKPKLEEDFFRLKKSVLVEEVAKDACDNKMEPRPKTRKYDESMKDFRLPLELIEEAYELDQVRLKLKAEKEKSEAAKNLVESKQQEISDTTKNLVERKQEEISDTTKNLAELKQEEISDTKKSLSESKHENISDTKKSLAQSEQEEISDTKKSSVESKQEEIIDIQKNFFESKQATPKTPRRVPLVTLASPSSKTKRKL